jgi:hypothetical protein
MKTKISQSLIKDMRSYLAGNQCGLIVKAKYIDDMTDLFTSDSMELGAYFEYILTGALPKSGKVPQPQYMQTPLKKKKPEELTIEDMLAPYRLAHANKDRVLAYWKNAGFVIAKDKKTGKPMVGMRLTKGRHEGTIDVVLEATKKIKFSDGFTLKKGDRIIVDIKYSGFVGDNISYKNIHGWQWSEEQKEYHGTQAKQYSYVFSAPDEFVGFEIFQGDTE